MDRAFCKRCAAPIIWVSTRNDRRMALDFEPERAFVVDAAKNPPVATERNVYTCHFENCRKA